ncbi:MAG: c-type cytochrome biogenesis protein CcsB, partial [Gammaproteobacteria bacterium]|nr:c-type cytochrome biogenesis protein CcsB [Gammaproteobacteria bacterium]
MSVSENQMYADLQKPSLMSQISGKDWAWFALLTAAVSCGLVFYSSIMDSYEVGILIGVGLLTAFVGWYWKSSVRFAISVAVISLFAVWLYGASLAAAEQNFF